MRLLITRNYAGIGDWLMTLAVLKMLNRQRPDVDVHVSFETPREPMPAIVPEAFAASDVRFSTVPPGPPYVQTGHFVYTGGRHRTAPWIEDMVEILGLRTGIRIRYEEGVFPTFVYPAPTERGYVALISQGKGVNRRKEWDGFQALAHILAAQGVPLVQIGAKNDQPLEAVADRRLGQPFDIVAKTLAGARCFVGIENGLMVLAGFLGVPQITLYCGAGSPDRLRFERQIQARDRYSPEEIAELVLSIH